MAVSLSSSAKKGLRHTEKEGAALRRTVIGFIIFFLFLVPLIGRSNDVEIMKVDQIKRGMKGVGRTVFEGTEVEDFDVEILGVLKNRRGTRGDLILARLSGRPGGALERAGQVIAGMSGSPIYIDGKLIGAVAYTWPFAKEAIAGITPIEDMIKVLERGLEGRSSNLSSDVFWEDPGIAVPEEVASLNPEVKEFAGAVFRPIATPVMFGGFDQRVIDRIAPELAKFGMMPIQGGSGTAEVLEDVPFEPGSAVGVQMVRGDLNITGIGTLTYRDGDRIVAFGHPIFLSGSTDLPMTGAYIFDVLPSRFWSFKFGVPAHLFGSVRQDRWPAIAGVIGELPDMIPVKALIGNSEGKTSYHFEVLRNRQLSPMFIRYALYNAILVTERVTGEVTIQAKSNIEMEGYPVFERENVYAGHGAISRVVSDLTAPAYSIIQNPFEKVMLKAISFDVTVQEEIRAAWIEGIRVDRKTLRPGDYIRVTVLLKRYLGEEQEEQISLKVPKDTPEGMLLLRVGDATSARSWDIERSPEKYRPRDFVQLLEILRSEGQNDELTVELFRPEKSLSVRGREMPSLPPSVLTVMKSSGQAGQRGAVKGVVIARTKLGMDYVVSGSQSLSLEVKRELR
ncbi:MAG TPA: hypothetical protein EYP53_02520 [Candidatus Latescibacteria bacterium]|nr:hypothetical protein [Candidatus Latescibacterota bacterium]